MGNTELFSGKSQQYAKGRPSYSAALMEYLFTVVGVRAKTQVADIGAGTGIFSRLLLERGCDVVCVEPNVDMRSVAVDALEGFSSASFSEGSAEATGLEDASVDFITVAQAFHWFDVDLFKKESRRILKPHGKALLVWNMRDTQSVFSMEQHSIFSRYCKSFKGFSGGKMSDDTLISEYFSGCYTYAEFDNPVVYSKSTFINRCLSSSYSLRSGDVHFAEYIGELEQLFDRFSKEGTLVVSEKSVVYWGYL